MTRNKTSRMGLIKESPDELIDQWGYNWPILDAFSGVQLVDPGYSPPTSQLYDGAIVVEKNTDIIWMAKLNPDTGSFDKKWLVYPFVAYCYGSISFTTGIVFKDLSTTSWDATRSKNFNGPVGGKIVVPVNGVYSATGLASWDPYDAGARECLISFNGADDYMRNEDFHDCNHDTSRTVTKVTEYVYLKAGDKINLRGWQTTGVTLGVVRNYLTVEMIAPL